MKKIIQIFIVVLFALPGILIQASSPQKLLNLLESINAPANPGAVASTPKAADTSIKRLVAAAFHNDTTLIEKLLQIEPTLINQTYPVPNNAGGSNNITPLIAAALKGNNASIELLLEKGADISIKTADGDTAYDAYSTCNNPDQNILNKLKQPASMLTKALNAASSAASNLAGAAGVLGGISF